MPAEEQPIVKNSAFAPAMGLKNHDEAIAEDGFVLVYPETAFTGTSTTPPTQTTVRLQYKAPAGRYYVDLSKSLVRVRMRFAANAGFTAVLNPATAAQNIAVARFGAANLFSQASLKVGGKQIENQTNHAEATSMLYNTLASDSSFNTNLTLVWAQQADSDRSVTTTAGYLDSLGAPQVQTWDLWFRPALAAFWTNKLVRTGGSTFELTLQLDAAWAKKIIVAQEAYSVSTAALLPKANPISGRVASVVGTNYFCDIQSLAWKVYQVLPKDSVPVADQDVLDMSMLTVIPSDLAVSTVSNNQFVIPPDSYKMLVGYQEADVGADGTVPIYEFQNSGLTDIRVNWSGKTLPASPYDGLDFITGPVSEPYADFMRATNQLDKAEGGAMSERYWRSRCTMYAFALAAAEGGKSTNLRLTSTFAVASTAGARVLCGFVSPLRVFFAYDASGRMVSISVSEENASSALISNQ